MSEILNRKHGASVEIINPQYTSPDPKNPAPLFRIRHKGESAQIYTKHRPRIEQEIIAEPAWNCLMIYVFANFIDASMATEDHGTLLQRLCWLNTDILPQHHQVRKVHPYLSVVTFGENPNEETEDIFGRAVPVARVEFLGHPDTFIAEIMSLQTNDYNPELITPYPEADKSYQDRTWKREVLASSPVSHTTIKHFIYNPGTKANELVAYAGEVMTFIEMKVLTLEHDDKYEHTCNEIPDSLRIGIGIIADKDQKLRVYHSGWQDLSTLSEKQKTEIIFRMLDGYHHLSKDCETEVNISELLNWEPRAFDAAKIQLHFPDVKRLRPRMNVRTSTYNKPSENKETVLSEVTN